MRESTAIKNRLYEGLRDVGVIGRHPLSRTKRATIGMYPTDEVSGGITVVIEVSAPKPLNRALKDTISSRNA